MDDQRPVLRWSQLTVGETLGPYQWVAEAEDVAAFRAAVGDHELPAAEGEDVAPPAMLTFPFLQLLEQSRRPRPGTVHAQQEFHFLAPLRVGATLQLTGVLSGMWVKRGRRYFQIDAEAVDDRGRRVATSVTVAVYPDSDIAPA